VKISTAFKGEMRDIDAVALKVWLYIALSINRNTDEAFPGARKIAKDCGINKDTVTAAIKRLEEYGLLTVHRKDKKISIYRVPSAYVSANKSVRPNRTDKKLSDQGEDLSGSDGHLSEQNPNLSERPAGFVHNQINQINQIKPEDIAADEILASISRFYENEIGLLTPMIADFLRDAAKDYPAGWVEDAIHAAARHNARNWAYVETILKRWKKDGKNTQFQLSSNRKEASNIAPDGSRYASGQFAEFIQH
jgi:DnaD/phage-associated family protein